MIEKARLLTNAKRELVLLCTVSLLSLLFLWIYPWNWGLDLSGGTQLIYEADIDTAKELGQVPKDATTADIMASMIPVIEDRVNPGGINEAVVTQQGEQNILVEIPKLMQGEAELVENRIENLGSLELRMLAYEDYTERGASFKLADEKTRLETWLNADGNANRKLVSERFDDINRFNLLPTEQGGPLAGPDKLRWYPRKLGRNFRDRSAWDEPMAGRGSGPTNYIVKVYSDDEFRVTPDEKAKQVEARLLQQGRRLSGDRLKRAVEDQVYLLELVPINMVDDHFTGEHLDAAGVMPTTDPRSGLPALAYVMNNEHKLRYADWSEKNLHKLSGIILNGVLRSAPSFEGRIYGNGIIHGNFTTSEVSDLAKVLKTGSLRVKPTRLSKVEIGATLGEKAVRLGMWSIVIGSSLVFAFILFYYRLAGIVAVVGLLLNVLMIFGIMQFVRATYTLPGLAGIVLTIGMAVDANILVYERIREELQKGKALLQAVSAGFDRAMVTILDANITTFLAGVVLYNIGVGPIKGFAVAMMIGIVTTVFTAFFVCRLAFHFMLASGWMREFNPRRWMANINYNWLGMARKAAMLSAVVIIAGLVYALMVPNSRKLGLDFTGGANLRVALAKPATAEEVRAALERQPGFTQQFPNALINSSGAVVDGRATEFGIKLKLTNDQRRQYSEERRQAKKEDKPYKPPYLGFVEEGLKGLLVASPYTDQTLVQDPNNLSAKRALIDLHFQTPVKLADVEKVLATGGLSSVSVHALTDKPETTDTTTGVHVEFATASITNETQIFATVSKALGELRDSTGMQVQLSDPIPAAEEIAGRMVDELRNSAIGALVISWFIMILYVRIRFHEYKFGIAAVVALVHDVLVSFVAVVFFNSIGLVNAEIDLGLIAAFLTIIGYSVNDTIVIFDRIRENTDEAKRLGATSESFGQLANRSINQTMSRTILTSGATLVVVVAQFVLNYGSGSSLEGFSFALLVGFISGVYSTIFIATPVVMWLRARELKHEPVSTPAADAPGPATA